jgi:hypothetical protein
MCHTPIENRCLCVNPSIFLRVDDEKTQKTRCLYDRLQLLATILAKWWHPVASSEALNLLYWAMCAVLYRRTAQQSKWPEKWVHLFIIDLFAVALAAAGAIRSE